MEELNNKEAEGRELYVGRAQKKAERLAELKDKFERMKMERINRYQGVNLYVKNLDENIDDEKLRKEFSQFGTITSAKVRRLVSYSKSVPSVCISTDFMVLFTISEGIRVCVLRCIDWSNLRKVFFLFVVFKSH